MAGIGFALSKLTRIDNLSAQSMATSHAIMITAGPWIVIMVGLALISWFGVPLAGATEEATFRILVIYGFALSLVISGPSALEINLRVSALMFSRRFDQVLSVYFGALVLTSVVALIAGTALFFGVLQLDPALAGAATFCVLQIALLWLAMSMVAAIRQYLAVTIGFTLGLTVSVALGLGLANAGLGAVGLIIGFAAGLCLAFAILNALIVQTFPGPLAPIATALKQLVRLRPRSVTFVLAGLAGALAVWIDKLVVWQSSEGVIVGHSLVHAPRYDVPMFIAYLSIIPVMAVVATWLETAFFTAYRRYRDIVHSGGTLRSIEAQRERLVRDTIDRILSAFVLQIAVSLTLALASPLLVTLLGLDIAFLQVLRLALLGAAFHFLFQACCGVILFVQFGRAFMLLQLGFLVLNGGFTALLMQWPELLGLGYVLATAGAALLAYGVMLRTLGLLNRLTFLDNNPSIAR